jgi:glucose/arabinose dehydrogenase
MNKLAVAGAMIVALVVPAGCSGDSDSGGLPTLGGETNPTETPSTPTEAPTTPITSGPSSPSAGPASKTVAVHRRKVTAATAEQRAIADAYLNYLLVRLRAYNKAAVDQDAIGRVAAGTALTQVTSAVNDLKAKKHHTIGEVWVDIPTITLKGKTASLRSCLDNTTIDVDEAGKPVEPLTPYFVVTATLQKAGGTVWLVDSVRFDDKRCQ